MSKQTLTVDVDDFALVVSYLGFVTSVIGELCPDGPQRNFTMHIGDNLIELLLKYSDTETKEQLIELQKILITAEADTSVEN